MKTYNKILLAFLLCTSLNAQLSNLSDEFNRVCSLQDWQNVEEVEGWPETHLEDYDINTTNEGPPYNGALDNCLVQRLQVKFII